MTRINSAIPVRHLTDEHLLAEHREIKRLPYNLKQAIKSGSIKRIPKKFTLGPGHVTFFLDKMKFVYNRYCDIYDELKRREFNVESYHSNWNDIPACYYNNYLPTKEEYHLLAQRISERIKNSTKKYWHYCHKKVTKEKTIEYFYS